MKINEISSPANNLLKHVRALHERKYREKEREFLVEGSRAVGEAIVKGLRVNDVVVTETFFDTHRDFVDDLNLNSISIVADKLFHEISTTTSPAGIIAVASIPKHSFDKLFHPQRSLVVIADAVQDPGNLGTMMRTALAASATGMVLTKGTVDPFSPKVVRSAVGALFALPVVFDIAFDEAVVECRKRGLRIIACDAGGDKHVFDSDFRGPVALVFGNESNGFAEGQLHSVDEIVSIPMNPLSESLNVAVSSAVVLFNVVQQRIKSQK